ncbi:hypothetical protein [Candidatus Poriferisocius sp.]|uniref:hypothetical protein n=1 Tax=Candidatus Poriferisocius sp. TaxID=3101276 RepID=UPI003B01A311
MRFRFRELKGDDRQRFVKVLGLDDLADRVDAVGMEHGEQGRRMLGLSEQDCLSLLRQQATPLRLLELSEEHGGGMNGPWHGDRSKLFKAMCSLGITPSTSSRGGSYGYGKAGLIRGSAIRTVVAYTCFPEQPDDSGVTRRLLGMTYWGSHSLEGNSFNGTRWFARSTGDGGRPYENEEADEVAQEIGIAIRNASVSAELGTTLLVIDPTVDADGLLRATERFWWPALCDNDVAFEVSVTDETSEEGERHPRPKQNPDLRAFLDTFDNALTPLDARRDHYREHSLDPIGRVRQPGTVALASDPDGWSFPVVGTGLGTGGAARTAQSAGGELVGTGDPMAAEVSHSSLVALVRGPRMVVEYFEAARVPPHIRGTFVASDEADDMLRDTEPKAHDAWQTDGSSGDLPSESATLAKTVLKRIKQHVDKFRRDIKPKPKPDRELKLPVWDELARQLEGSVRGPGSAEGPKSQQRPFVIHPGGSLETAPDGQVRLVGKASIGFSQHYELTSDEGDLIEVRVRYQFEGADRKETHEEDLLVFGPDGFEEVASFANTYRGWLRSDETVEFTYESDPYNPDWSGELSVEANLVADEMSQSK